MKVAKYENCHNWTWFQYFLLKVSIFDELKIAKKKNVKIENCQDWKLPKLKVPNFECCQSWKWVQQFLLSYQIAKLPSCQIAKLPNCQVAKLQVAKLWTCNHGAKSLSFLFYFI